MPTTIINLKTVVVNGSGFMVDNAFRAIEWDDFVKLTEILDMRGKNVERSKLLANLKVFDLGDADKSSPLDVTNAIDCVGNCAKCTHCKLKRGYNIYLPVHGGGTSKNTQKRRIAEAIQKNPKIDKILADQSMTFDKKVEEIAGMLGDNEISTFKNLYRLKMDQKEFLANLLKDEEEKVERDDEVERDDDEN